MTTGKLFRKTMPFIWAKLLLGIIMTLISVALLVGFLALGWLFGEIGLIAAAILWIVVIRFVWYFIMHYFGYLIKAGHVAVIAEAYRTGQIPSGQVGLGKDMVRERFLTASVYSIVDRLVTGAVKEIQRKIGRIGNSLDFIPGAQAVTGLAQFFVRISLGYIDECCLGWTFYNRHQGVFKSAADGVVLYTQNWKSLLKNAAWTMFKVILLMIVIALIIFVPTGILFKVMGWHPLLALVIALFIAFVVKFAAMDSYIMVRMMASYLDVAPSTVITFDLYGNLCRISAKFKELFDRGQKEEPPQGYEAQPQGFGSRPDMQSAHFGQAQGFGGRPGGQGTQGVQNRQAPRMAPGPSAAPRPHVAPGSSAVPGPHVAPRQPAAPGPSAAPRPPVGYNNAAPAAAKPLYCTQCGARNDRNSRFCGECGAKL